MSSSDVEVSMFDVLADLAVTYGTQRDFGSVDMRQHVLQSSAMSLKRCDVLQETWPRAELGFSR